MIWCLNLFTFHSLHLPSLIMYHTAFELLLFWIHRFIWSFTGIKYLQNLYLCCVMLSHKCCIYFFSFAWYTFSLILFLGDIICLHIYPTLFSHLSFVTFLSFLVSVLGVLLSFPFLVWGLHVAFHPLCWVLRTQESRSTRF